jgi:hypothetical protein
MPRQIALTDPNPHRISAFIDYAYDTEAMNFRKEEIRESGRTKFQAVSIEDPGYDPAVITSLVEGFNSEWKMFMGEPTPKCYGAQTADGSPDCPGPNVRRYTVRSDSGATFETDYCSDCAAEAVHHALTLTPLG